MPDALRQTRPNDIILLLTARGLRGFGDGFAIIILPVYLAAIGLTTVQIGFVAAASLLGTAALTLAVGFVASRYELRTLLLVGASLIILTGLIFPNVGNIALILVIAFVGSLNPSAGDLGILVPLEHATLTREAADHDRTRIFARYSLIGTLATAAGSLAAAAPGFLLSYGVADIVALKSMFYLYALLGFVAALLYSRFPRDHTHIAATPRTALRQSRGIVFKLAALFSLDAFAGGFVVQSLLAVWLFERFDLSLAAVSVFFFWSTFLSAFSFPVAAWIAKRVGLINTMVYTHVPSSLCLIVAAFSQSLTFTLVLLLIRSALSQMDVPTRSSYVMAVVTPAERPAAASVTAVPRSLASSISPAFAGFMLAGAFPGLPLVLCGVLKITYDLALLYLFRHVKPPEEIQ
ncbi:MAG: MFS transporter [Terriglobia bacterium]